jgi:general secretion pathway protein A
MYLPFYELKEKPFNATPDPKFLYLTPGHREALAQLVYGIQESRGFAVLTSDVGTGKTTLLQALIQRLDGEAEVAYIPFSMLSFDEILTYMLDSFGVVGTIDSRVQRLQTLHRLLIDRRRAGQKTVLIIDEAQNLDLKTLEQIRLLSNFETPTEKLLQILLVGQPELKAKLEAPELQQLRQRIGLHCSLPLLTVDECCDYIRHRMRMAGAKDIRLFTYAAERRIAQYTGGIPRLLNIVCDHCLLFGYADQKGKIDRGTVDQAIAYLEEQKRPRRFGRGIAQWRAKSMPRWVFGVMLVAILGWMAFHFVGSEALLDTRLRLEAQLSAFAGSAQEVLYPIFRALQRILPSSSQPS